LKVAFGTLFIESVIYIAARAIENLVNRI